MDARWVIGGLAGLVLLAACAQLTFGTATTTAPTPRPGQASSVVDPVPDEVSPLADPSPDQAEPPPVPDPPVEIAYRVEVRTLDPAVADFPAVVDAVLSDPRGWLQAGFAFVRRDDAAYRIVLAEGPEVDALCLPYDTYGEYSCQNGPVVALNADRWRQATPQWTGDLASYRLMLVNHEVGHLLGQRHTDCPAPGELAPVMAQQSTELRGCLPNPWPLAWEVELAARGDQPIAPGYGQ